MRRAICARKHRFRIHSDDVNERVYGSLFRAVVSRILYAYFENQRPRVLACLRPRSRCLPASFPSYTFSRFFNLFLAREHVPFLLDVCFNLLSFLLTFVKIFYSSKLDIILDTLINFVNRLLHESALDCHTSGNY